MRYAQKTTIGIRQSQEEITRLAEQAGATQFMIGWDDGKAKPFVSFVLHGEKLDFFMDVPAPDAPTFLFTRSGRKRRQAMRLTIHNRAVNAAWRAMVLQVRAKIAALENRVLVQEGRA